MESEALQRDELVFGQRPQEKHTVNWRFYQDQFLSEVQSLVGILKDLRRGRMNAFNSLLEKECKRGSFV